MTVIWGLSDPLGSTSITDNVIQDFHKVGLTLLVVLRLTLNASIDPLDTTVVQYNFALFC